MKQFNLNPHHYPTTPVIDMNLANLNSRLNELEEACGITLVIDSGLRSDEQQAGLIKSGKTTAVHSKHLIGAAADILDADGLLTDWVHSNLDVMERIGFWMEDPESIANLAKKHRTSIWVHVQIVAPASGLRVYIP